jgi:hypothetical protein
MESIQPVNLVMNKPAIPVQITTGGAQEDCSHSRAGVIRYLIGIWENRSVRIASALLVAALVIATIAPLVVAMPLLSQTPTLLALAHGGERIAPTLSIFVMALVAVRLWRDRSWRVWALLCVTVTCAVLSRLNLFEWMFAPAREAAIAKSVDFHDIRDSDMVIGVTIDGESRAYPVRYLAFHHMLNDRLGSTALAPTY